MIKREVKKISKTIRLRGFSRISPTNSQDIFRIYDMEKLQSYKVSEFRLTRFQSFSPNSATLQPCNSSTSLTDSSTDSAAYTTTCSYSSAHSDYSGDTQSTRHQSQHTSCSTNSLAVRHRLPMIVLPNGKVPTSWTRRRQTPITVPQ